MKNGHTYRVRDRDLGQVDSTYNSMGVAADFMDLSGAYRPIGSAVYFGGIETVAAPGKRTEFYSAGDTAWDQLLSSSFPWGEFMTGEQKTYQKGRRTTASWYDGVTGPVAPRDRAGKETLAAERQGNLIGFAPSMWGDSSHFAQPGSFGDIGGLQLKRDGEVIGDSWYPFGVFEVPAEQGRYELTQNIEKIGPPSRTWQRSTAVQTTWGFTSKLDPAAYSQGLPVLFPRYAAPLDGMKTVAGHRRPGRRTRCQRTRGLLSRRAQVGAAVLLVRRGELDGGEGERARRCLDGDREPCGSLREAGVAEGRADRRERRHGHPDGRAGV